jgi:hypothetical protein
MNLAARNLVDCSMPPENAAAAVATVVDAPPTKIFDQLYYLGSNSVATWAIVTSAGIIQIDSLNNTADAQRVIIAGYKKLGLDPRQMKYLVSPTATTTTSAAQILCRTPIIRASSCPPPIGTWSPSCLRDRSRRRPSRARHGHHRRAEADSGRHDPDLLHHPWPHPGTVSMLSRLLIKDSPTALFLGWQRHPAQPRT